MANKLILQTGTTCSRIALVLIIGPRYMNAGGVCSGGGYLFKERGDGMKRRINLHEVLSKYGWILLTGLIAASLFFITIQANINGSTHPYVTDVGELQNALPRWGTIHFSGYPLYSMTGSLIVTLLRPLGIQPALGASLVSLFWGVVTAVFAALLAVELGASRPAAVLGTLIFSVSTSMWIDSSLAEVHSLSMMFIVAILYFAVRFDGSGKRSDLFWLTLFLSQGVFHGRAIIGLLPAIFLLIIPHWHLILRNLLILIGISLLAPLLYIYLPLREWMGADWTFGNTSTWEGFWRMFLNIKAGRFAEVPADSAGLRERITVTLSTLNDDLPLVLIILGLAGLVPVNKKKLGRWRYTAAFLLAWLPFAVVPVIVYAGFVGDAILAIKLPVSMFAGIGLALWVTRISGWRVNAGRLALGLATAVLLFVGWRNYEAVTAITKDRGIEETIAVVDQAANPEEPTVLTILWGHNFWAAAYAQAYRNQLNGVTLVDHNADFRAYKESGNRLITLSETFYLRPLSYWQKLFGEVYLEGYAPGLVEIRTAPQRLADESDALFMVNDELAIEWAQWQTNESGDDVLALEWVAEETPTRDYSVAVHVVSNDPPTGPQDIISQADSPHPVEGWYPTTMWSEGQVVQDVYQLDNVTSATAVRITAYYVDESGQFVNGNWLSIPVE